MKAEINNAVCDIKSLMRQADDLKTIRDNVFELTDVAHDNTEALKQEYAIDDVAMTKEIQNIVKPYVQKWLDQNLARIVKDSVETHIKKIIAKASE